MKKKRVTVDELATMVANGFHALQEEMRQGFASLTSRVDGVETTLAEHGQRLDRIERKLAGQQLLQGGLRKRRFLESGSKISDDPEPHFWTPSAPPGS
jgi:hypothetical protein